MKGTMKEKLIVVFVLMIVTLCSCGKTANEPLSGTYEGISAEMGGIKIDVLDALDDNITINLWDGGTGDFIYEGITYNISWKVDGNTFHAEGGGAVLDGTLADDILILENVLDSGINLTLGKIA